MTHVAVAIQVRIRVPVGVALLRAPGRKQLTQVGVVGVAVAVDVARAFRGPSPAVDAEVVLRGRVLRIGILVHVQPDRAQHLYLTVTGPKQVAVLGDRQLVVGHVDIDLEE